jgi:sugar/nucleoside kinase (ribokinase family)
LLNSASLAECAQRLLEWGLPVVYLRAGAQGALVLAGGRWLEIPSVSGVEAVDPTGAGNSSSAGVLCGYCQGVSPWEYGVMGSISAAMCVAGYGMPERIDDEKKRWARELLAAAPPPVERARNC